jgi:hypothetical protein
MSTRGVHGCKNRRPEDYLPAHRAPRRRSGRGRPALQWRRPFRVVISGSREDRYEVGEKVGGGGCGGRTRRGEAGGEKIQANTSPRQI